MSKPIARTLSVLLLAAATALTASRAHAQSTNQPTPTRNAAAPVNEPGRTAKKPAGGPFRGKLAAKDNLARTITVGKRTFYITPQTKLNKNGKPAALEDGVVGEVCSGYAKPDKDGKLQATTVNFGPKTEAKGAADTKGNRPKNKQEAR